MDTLVNIPTLDEIADLIDKASNRMETDMSHSTLELGELFSLARASFPPLGNSSKLRANRPGWGEWIAANTRWQANHVTDFINIFERFGASGPGQMLLRLGPTSLRRLASPATPTEALEEVNTRLATGEYVTRDEVQYIIKSYKAGNKPKPKKALKRGKRGKEKFIRSTQMVCQLAQTAFDLDIPLLTKSELTDIIEELEEARGNIGKIISQLKEDLK